MLFPNLGAEYTGRPPYTLPLSGQAAIDAILQKMGAEGTRRYQESR